MDRRTVLSSGAVIALAAAVGRARAQEVAGFAVDGRVALEAYRSLVEEHLTGVRRGLRALAATSDARAAQWARIRPALSEFARDLDTAAAVTFMLPDGTYYSAEKGRIAANLKDRDYFPPLLAGQDVRDALVVSKSTGERAIVVATPVKRDGKVVAALGVSVSALKMSELVRRDTKLPADLVFYALDPKGRTAIHRDPERMFEFPSDLGDPSLAHGVAAIMAKDAGSVDYEFRGQRRSALFARSDMTGWRFVLAKTLA